MGWQVASGVSVERVDGQWLVLAGGQGVVHLATGPAGEVLDLITSGHCDLPARYDDAVAALADAGVLVVAPAAQDATDNALRWSRRRVLTTTAAGAALVGLGTLALPAAAMAASSLAAPTNVTATANSGSQVTITWDLVATATSYQLFSKLASDSTYASSGGPVTIGAATATGLTTGLPYNFYVTATDGAITSLPSDVVTATPAATGFARTGAVALDPGEDNLNTAITDGTYGYFGTSFTSPGKVVRVRLSDMARMDAVSLEAGEVDLRSSVIAGGFGYFGTLTTPSQVVKVNLGTMARVEALELAGEGESYLYSAVTDGTHGYFGTYTGRVVKVDLANMTKVSTVDLDGPINPLQTAVTAGGFGYFGTLTTPGRVLKLDLATMTRVGEATTLEPGEGPLLSAIIDGTYGYFGTGGSPGRVVKVDLATMTRVGAVTLDAGEDALQSAVLANGFGYFGTFTNPGRVVRVNLATMTRVEAITLTEFTEQDLSSAVTSGGFAYFGTVNTNPAEVVKIDLGM